MYARKHTMALGMDVDRIKYVNNYLYLIITFLSALRFTLSKIAHFLYNSVIKNTYLFFTITQLNQQKGPLNRIVLFA